MAKRTRTLVTQFKEPTKTAANQRWYKKQLLKVVTEVERIAKSASKEEDPIIQAADISGKLSAYSSKLSDWAKEVARKMIVDADEADYATWKKVGQTISNSMRRQLSSDVLGDVYDRLQAEQVELITSLPLEAAQKVHEWTKDGLARGERFEASVNRIQGELGPVTRSRAVCIARTETARARTSFTRARAQRIGSPGYYWRTVGDADVRPMHKRLNGTFHTWNDPPICDIGKGGAPIRALPGAVWNCRCFPEPIYPGEDDEHLK